MNIGNQINLAAIEALEDAEVQAEGVRRVYPYNDPCDCLTDIQFRSTFRLTKEAAINLIDELTPFIVAPNRSSALSVRRKVLTALRFYASGSYQMDMGHNINNAVSQASVSKSIEEVSTALNRPEIFNRYVHFPRTVAELRTKRNEFFEKHNFPAVVGCLDCTHVAIFPPHVNDVEHPEHIYMNRKGYHSINVQLICDTSLKILNVCARYPGSTHDSFIWNNSRVSVLMKNLHRAGHTSFCLLGDSGYALRSWLLTPVENPQPNTPEYLYNIRHRQTRALIEQCNVLKTRFRCLLTHRVLHYTPEKACSIINACAVLHNICIINRIPEVLLEPFEEQFDYGMMQNANVVNEIRNVRINPELAAERNMREQVIRTHFT